MARNGSGDRFLVGIAWAFVIVASVVVMTSFVLSLAQCSVGDNDLR